MTSKTELYLLRTTRVAYATAFALAMSSPSAWAQDEPLEVLPEEEPLEELPELEVPPEEVPPEDLETPDVVITGTRIERALEDAPVRTQVVRRDQLQQRKARNLAESLDYMAGVRVEANCQNCGFTQLRLNGLAGAYTQVLIDGLPSFSGLAGVYGLEQLPAEMIQRVEVVKGGGSALYGPSAVAGVVNVVTRKPREDFFSALVSYDVVGLEAPDLRLTADGGVVSPDGRLAAHVFASHRRRGGLDLSGDGFTELTRIDQLAGGANLFVTPFDGAELRVSFLALQEHRRGGDRLDLPAHEAAIAEELNTERVQGDVRFTHEVSPNVSYALGYAIAYTDRRSYYGGGGDADPTPPVAGEPVTEEFLEDFEAERVALGGYGRTLNPTHVGDAHVDLSYDALGPQTLTVGGQVNVDDVNDRYLGYDREIDDTFTVVGAYLQHDWIFADWGESVVGVRVDQHSELDAPIASPRVALSLRPGAGWRLRSAFATGFRAPQAFDEDLHIETVGGSARIIENDPGLRPERSMSLAQQVAYSTDLPNGWDLGVSLNGYLNRLDDAFVLNERDDPATPEEEAIRENRGTTTVLGAELEASLQAPLWAVRAGWTLENAANDEPDEDFEQLRLLRTPQQYGYLEAVLSLGSLQAQTGVDVTGPMLVGRYDEDADPDALIESPWFASWNANVSYATLAAGSLVFEPFVGVRNILDSRQGAPDLFGPGRTEFSQGSARDAGFVFGPPLPRTVFAGIRGTL
jgi:outer membrane receptor for ferrienterochelin and colicins